MVKKILAGVLVVVLILVVVIALQPSTFRIIRSATIAAPAPVIFAEVNNLHHWERWSPWDKIDPAMKKTFDGPEEGEGASYAWAGNSEIGEGQMTIIESKPAELVKIRLDFYSPMEGTSISELRFVPSGEKTEVSWSISGENDFMGKAFGLFMDMDKMIGDNFEKGLADLKSITESEAKPTSDAAPTPPAQEAPPATP